MSRRKQKKTVGMLLVSFLLLGGCGTAAVGSTNASSTNSENGAVSSETTDFDLELTESEMDTTFTDREKAGTYETSGAVKINLSKLDSITGNGISVSDNVITISQEGTYIVSGTLTDGQIIIDADDTDKVQLVLNGAEISCDTSAAIYVKEADKVFLTLAEGTENALSGGETYEQTDDNNVDGVIFSKTDLACNGSGTLSIQASYKHGIVAKDDLVITGGTYQITAAENGIIAKDQLKILDGTFTITAGEHAVKAKNEDEETLGNLYIAGGRFTLTSEEDGLHATGSIVIDDGTFTISAGDDGVHADKDTVINDGTIEITKSYEGLEGKRVVVNGGKITLSASDDGVNAASSDANTTAEPSGNMPEQKQTKTAENNETGNTQSGDITEQTTENDRPELPQEANAEKSTEQNKEQENFQEPSQGEEDANGEQNRENSSSENNADMQPPAEDRQNMPQMQEGEKPDAPGGMKDGSMQSNSEIYIKITGGNLTVSADGDGLDSNGNLLITGGTTLVYGPTSSGDGALDYDGTAVVTGGTLAAAGSAGMAQGFTDTSTQYSITYYCSETQTGGTEVTVSDDDGTELFTFTPQKAYQSLVLTFPALTSSQTYTLQAGTETTSITLDTTVTTSGTAPTQTMGGRRGMHGSSDNQSETLPSRPENQTTETTPTDQTPQYDTEV